ncbi:DUF6090 family protein [Alteromonas sp. ASW11-36]|uniref:DUF6090 family protein n=1 Tax=Alteromonas arenosi TaxID=3055817 RepID=A0ABT7SYE8_9ALTE|nr:DUF6090 family protein [Alteromonas sp. ASW11-36]MDM7861223.1 DUF6090 family protein [Alteromonas sp. ASW11-36]
MIIRRYAQHIRDQNWSAFILDIFVVLIGVYLAVVIGQWDAQRTDRESANQSLTFLHQDLKDDMEQLSVILTKRAAMSSTLEQMIEALLESPVNVENVARINQKLDILETPTFFPNKSVYKLMLENGQLVNLQDKDLVRDITKLFDYSNNRNDVYSYLSDAYHDAILRDTRHQYFDRSNETLLIKSELELGKLRSGLAAQKAYGQGYSDFLRNTLLPAYMALDKKIESYLLTHTAN